MATSAICLVWGWFFRRTARANIAWRVLCVPSTIGQSLWAIVLVVSQARALSDTGGVGHAPGIYQDTALAALAIVSIALLVRDQVAAARRRRRTPRT